VVPRPRPSPRASAGGSRRKIAGPGVTSGRGCGAQAWQLAAKAQRRPAAPNASPSIVRGGVELDSDAKRRRAARFAENRPELPVHDARARARRRYPDREERDEEKG
jgi:hypothetical protein